MSSKTRTPREFSPELEQRVRNVLREEYIEEPTSSIFFYSSTLFDQVEPDIGKNIFTTRLKKMSCVEVYGGQGTTNGTRFRIITDEL